MATPSNNILFLTTQAMGSSPAAGFSGAFFDAVQGTGLGVTAIEAFRTAPSELPGSLHSFSFLSSSLAGRLPERVDAICSFGPLPAAAIGELRAKYAAAKLVACLDCPADFREFEPTIEASDAAIVAHISFERFIPGATRRGGAHNRLIDLSARGLLFHIMPGIDLKGYDPATDGSLSRRGGKFCAEYPQSKGGIVGPSGKKENYHALRHALGLDPSRDAENMAIADPGALNAGICRGALGHYPGGIAAVFFGDGPASDDAERLIAWANRRGASSRRSAYISTSDDAKFRLLLAGSGYAVFFEGLPPPGYPSASQIRSVLLFMRYGAMPIVPRIFEDWEIVERCVLPRGTDRDTWLYPKGFAFIHDGSATSISDAISSASMHDFRTNIGHGIFSKAVPNAMDAAAGHDIRTEGRAFAAALRRMIGDSI